MGIAKRIKHLMIGAGAITILLITAAVAAMAYHWWDTRRRTGGGTADYAVRHMEESSTGSDGRVEVK